MLANVSLQGNIAKEPELKYTANGTAMLKFPLAVNTGWGDNKVASFYDITCFGKHGESIAPHLSKGKQIVVAGEISIRKSTSEAGIKYTNVQVNANSINFVSGGQQSDAPADNDDPAVPF